MLLEIGNQIGELTDLATMRLERAAKKAQVRIRRRRMTSPPAGAKEEDNVFVVGTRAERRRGKIEVRAEFQRHFRDIAEDVEELNRYFDDLDLDDDLLDLDSEEFFARGRDPYPDEPPSEFYASGHYLDDLDF